MDLHVPFLVLGALLLLGLITDEIGRRTRLPRVTLLILFGLLAGPSGLDILPAAFQAWYEFLATTALTMIAFLLGGKLSLNELRWNGQKILTVSLAVVAITALLVSIGLLLIGIPVIMALLIASIAPATDPAATQDVIRQANASGPFTDTLLGVVAVDDAWGLIVFSLLLVIAKAIAGDGGYEILEYGMRDLIGSLVLGTLIGLPAAFLTGRLRPGEPIQSEALGLVFLCAGLATWLEVSFLLTGMIAGAIVVNFAAHHNRPFHEIEHIEWPFMVLFFVLAGAALRLDSLNAIGMITIAYLILRIAARFLGGYIGGRIAGMPPLHCRWIGWALVPQAGVALGMALVAADHFPDLGNMLLAITISSTIIFEVIGPILTLLALHIVGEGE